MARREDSSGAIGAAALCAALLIAQQVGAKTTRDALFLENLDVSLLPRTLAVAAVVTVVFVLGAGRLIARFGPARVVPVALVLSAALQLGVFAWAGVAAAPAAVGYYLLVAATGALLVSGFWSVVNERFDPRTARRSAGRIGTGATFGGLAGGVLALVVGHAIGARWLLLLLAALHLAAALVLHRFGRSGSTSADESSDTGPIGQGWQVLRRQTFVRDLALVVVLLTAGAACLDYVFKDFAQERFGDATAGIGLVTFFGAFHTGTALLTFLLQSAFAPLLLRHAGLARTLATLPGGLALGAVALLLVPLWPVAAIARAAESGLRSSLFRSAYEPLYTPLAPSEKRASKSLIDVGGERLGDAIGALTVQVLLLVVPVTTPGGILHSILLATTAITGVLGLAMAARLHRGYIEALERSLMRQHVELELDDVVDTATRTMILRTRPGDAAPARHADPSSTTPRTADPVVETVEDLRSRDPKVVVRSLAASTPLAPELVGHVVPLLAWDGVAESAIEALRRTGRRAAGPLVSALLDESEDFSVRRRVPRALTDEPDPLVRTALLQGIAADRFEIRFRCAQALARIRESGGPPVPREPVMEQVRREVSVPDTLWRSHRLLDGHLHGPPFGESPAVRRAPAALQHVFGLLALVLPHEALGLCLEGILTHDRQLRGTALEYLDGVLPADVRQRLWPKLEGAEAMVSSSTGDPDTALRTLMGSRRRIRTLLSEDPDDDGPPPQS